VTKVLVHQHAAFGHQQRPVLLHAPLEVGAGIEHRLLAFGLLQHGPVGGKHPDRIFTQYPDSIEILEEFLQTVVDNKTAMVFPRIRIGLVNADGKRTLPLETLSRGGHANGPGSIGGKLREHGVPAGTPGLLRVSSPADRDHVFACGVHERDVLIGGEVTE
jgi:hypothetical protein